MIRIGDRVKILQPEFVTRVGYPLTIPDVKETVLTLYHEELQALVTKIAGRFNYPPKGRNGKFFKEIVSAVSKMYLEKVDYGGRSRSLRTVIKPEYQDKYYIVVEKKNVRTGLYYPASGGYDSFSGESDYEPGGLANAKTHVLLSLAHNIDTIEFIGSTQLWIEQIHVEKCQNHSTDRQVRRLV